MTTKKLTHEELAAAQERKDWALLWQHAMPLVKLAVRRSKHRGAEEKEELEQQGMLIAGEAIRAWPPLECAFSTFIVRRVSGDLANYLIEKDRGGIGSYKQNPTVLSLGDERADVDSVSDDDRDEDDGTFDAALTYAGVVMRGGQHDGEGYVPQGFGDPSVEADVNAQTALRAALQHLTAEEIELVSTVYGLGGGRTQTLAQYAEARHLPYRTAKRRMQNIRAVLAPQLQNFRN